MNYTASIRSTPTPKAAGTQYFALDVDEVPAVGGSRRDRLPDVSGPQERVERRTVQQTIAMLDALVPQTVVQLVEMLKLRDTMVPEQVIEAPKITSQDVIPPRAVLRVPQMAEQLVEVPTVPCLPQGMTILARFSDAAGHSWSQVAGPPPVVYDTSMNTAMSV